MFLPDTTHYLTCKLHLTPLQYCKWAEFKVALNLVGKGPFRVNLSLLYLSQVLGVLWLVDLMVCILKYTLLDFVVCFPAQFSFQEISQTLC